MLAMVLSVGFIHYHTAAAATVTIQSHPVSVHPQRVPAGKPTGLVFTCQPQPNPDGIVCYSPEQMQNAYNVTPLLKAGITGKGKTIIVIDAYQNPDMVADLANFDSVFGLPAPKFTQVAPDGLTPFDPTDPNQVGWAGEIALDVQWSHAMAPGANIVLDLAKSNQDADLLSVTKYAVDHHLGDIITQSFGENEACVDPTLLKQEHQVFAEATLKHMTIFASSGDEGAAQTTCDGNSWTQAASSPASDPLVTGVGATELLASQTCADANGNEIPCPGGVKPGTYESESALNEPPGLFTDGSFSTGGGYSTLYKEPFYQFGSVFHNFQRGVPDVAINGSIGHGVLVSFLLEGGFYIFGGTSCGSPEWAGITALADQKAGRDLGFINGALYTIGNFSPVYSHDFHDITTGNNTVQEPDVNNNFVTVQGFNATKKWDATTGLGTPNVANLLALIMAYDDADNDVNAVHQMGNH
jgi:subtilase family serine protease